jgi:predicted dehydrogenase
MRPNLRAHSWQCAALAVAVASQLAAAEPLRLITVDPGHFHAAQLHTTMLPGFSGEAHVYAPLGPELIAYLSRVAQYNSRPKDPTQWKLDVYAGPDFLERMRAEPPGNMVMLSGRNGRKMDYIEAAVRAGQNILADKPWIIDIAELPRLEAILDLADRKRLIAYDAMTQRFDIAYQLQQALVTDSALLGKPLSVEMASTHYLLKSSMRPVWFFDLEQQGEGIADVGTHLVDLLEWTLFPGQGVTRKDVQVLDAGRSPLMLSREDFERVSGEKNWPDFARPYIRNGEFAYYCNNDVSFTMKGVKAHFTVRWSFEAKDGLRDTMLAIYTGSKARVQVRQNKEEKFVPEVDVIPVEPAQRTAVQQALTAKLKQLAPHFPGLSLTSNGDGFRIIIPQALRIPDERYFALLTERFLGYVRSPGTLPAWEKADMVTKYYITTRAVQLAREKEKSR